MELKTVVVGMSGGVDSSVAALLLKQQGYSVIGAFMKNWEEKEKGLCRSTADFEDVVHVCHQIGIPYYVMNFSQDYWERVFSHCLEEFARGNTPNPDVLCNREIKFKVFLEKALRELRADFLATGHYCQTKREGEDLQLHRGVDPNKDQSYFLYTLTNLQLERVLFPIGHLTKPQVRELAAAHGLITAQKKDSTGLCFVGKRPFKPFLSNYLPLTPGKMETLDGRVVGEHDGLAYYTIGQRKGLGIGGAGPPWFVVGKEPQRNVLLVVQGEDHSALFYDGLEAEEAHWVGSPPPFPHSCHCKIRYRAEDVPCSLTREGKKILIAFDSPQKAVTPKQAVVFYEGSRCWGGATISRGLRKAPTFLV